MRIALPSQVVVIKILEYTQRIHELWSMDASIDVCHADDIQAPYIGLFCGSSVGTVG